ncbi:hypothetical protein JYU34_002620 [Plutella xylostella]|uniref:Alpha N-terminal protein methyltransferase 1 n=1 Tax=Plutella xylostella TaxID=51655 RepID=A0ABQ7R2P9_PLUXY|nr:alpha N-terminal protein methyltransferase 1 [Plutella xylostella]KAG7311571.1 hypothetical protein JYU34_002620 [Plutella xylostella]
MNNKSETYRKASEYWASIPATLDGVLGGFGYISDIDIDGSKLFLKALQSLSNPPDTRTALDCGAGIGRISKLLLLPNFDTVDVVEPDEKFIENLKIYVGDLTTKLGSVYKCCLQDFNPDKKYDVIWNQWVLGHLIECDLVSYLIRCKNALTENGIIVIKENVASSGRIEKDDTDSSVTRPLKQFLQIFKKAKLKRIKQCKQTNFPEGIYPVYMFALVPMEKEVIPADGEIQKIETINS